MNYGEGTLSPAEVSLLDGRNNDGFGAGNGAWWIVLFLIFGWGRGFGGYGNFGGGSTTSVYEGYVLNNDFSQLSKQISDTYNMTDRKLDGLSNGLCSLGYQELQNINSVNTNLFNGFANVTSAITTNGYETRNAITQDTIANMQNANAIQSAIKDCCCTTQRSIDSVNRTIDGVNYNIATNTNNVINNMNAGFTNVQQSMCLNTRDIIENNNNNTRSILDFLVKDKIDTLQNENASLKLCASQTAQNQYLINQLKPCPSPAYIVPSPYCNCNNGCGCN